MGNLLAERRAQMFPKLTRAQIQRLEGHGARRPMHRGELLFEQGEIRTKFMVVLEGRVEVIHPGLDGDRIVTIHQPGDFTGDVSILSGHRSFVRGRALEDGLLLELDLNALRTIVQTDSELSELFMRAFILRRMGFIEQEMGAAVLLGSQHSAETLRLKEFLFRNHQPYTFKDVDHEPDLQKTLDRFQIRVEDVPVMICQAGYVLKNPSNAMLAEALALNAPVDTAAVHDLVVVGAGPAGLSAAVYAASEGLDPIVLETHAPGGQAGSSSKIENYLGFPTGISGGALAGRAMVQAVKFGATVWIARTVTGLRCEQRPYVIELDSGPLRTRTLVLAMGVEYRKPAIPNREQFEGNGIYYGATHIEAQLCSGEEVIVVGGGNSAGQAAVFLSGSARQVHMLVRSGGLAESMSRYLIRRIDECPSITMHLHTQIVGLEGKTRLEQVTWHNNATGETETRPIGHVFMMTGAVPNTQWLRGCIALDDKGFIPTGPDLSEEALREAHWPLSRHPYLLETSLPGVFAVGDVRAGNVKRVASAVGEGSICIQLVHKVLAE